MRSRSNGRVAKSWPIAIGRILSADGYSGTGSPSIRCCIRRIGSEAWLLTDSKLPVTNSAIEWTVDDVAFQADPYEPVQDAVGAVGSGAPFADFRSAIPPIAASRWNGVAVASTGFGLDPEIGTLDELRDLCADYDLGFEAEIGMPLAHETHRSRLLNSPEHPLEEVSISNNPRQVRIARDLGDLGEGEAATSGIAGERHLHRVNPLPFHEQISVRFPGRCWWGVFG